MNSKRWFAANLSVLLLAGCLFVVHAQSSRKVDVPAVRGKLEGTWRLASHKYGSATAFTAVPREPQTRLKYITSSHFIWVVYDPKTKELQDSAGGTIVVNGNVLKETPQFGLGEGAKDLRDKEQTFDIKVDGDTYRQSGTLVFGGQHPGSMKLEEIWERVK